ncbi:phosphoethanolamine transferase [Duganella violaceipulchra]|uniref:Glucan phosphoethanolaminetransferase (Alkaline phosphatase superfamily) n=1 Tax=Duganella violaceipulchra TaxID=2849652 RepID=A0AA41L2E6_9BURK|nr:phosphoethanolamine transferase [Duganella violaceicalia]MBV6322258.1 phosphoethanolamine transferase [Duganella violaceicalia]MCP2011405.1 glucan phosphoethanolaminetransferase (alkaline phosphatase superfamily) [Duganella violaceicalia]
MQIPRLARSALYYAAALVLSFLFIRAFGYHAKANNVLNICGLLLLLLGSGMGALRMAAYALLLAAAIYMPVGMVYGKPDFLIIASLLQSNRSESIEFIGQMPVANFLLALTFAAAAWVFVFRLNQEGWQKQRRLAGVLIAVLSLAACAKSMQSAQGQKEILALDLPRSVAQAMQQYHKEQQGFLAVQAANQWQVRHLGSQYRNYVIVVGESVRRDHMSLYGYPQKTTPFADQANGVFIDGYVSPAPNTFVSVPRTLAEASDTEVAYGRNVVALARQAGFRTYWLSNQGYVGEYDSPSSRLAASADVVHFTKLGSSLSTNIDDRVLLAPLVAGLRDGQRGPRLFVLHLMGSHPAFCDRVQGEERNFTASSAAMRCYLGSIRHTDSLLADAYQALRAAGQPFSMIYLSDHGLRHKDQGTADASLVHDDRYRQNYAVPFFILSSDATAHTTLHKAMSGVNFVRGAAQWMGIQAEGLPRYEFTSPAPDAPIQVFNGSSYRPYGGLQDDPA